MIEQRLRLHADVLFADEHDSLNEQKSKLVESDEAKRQLLEELQSQFQLVSTEDTTDPGPMDSGTMDPGLDEEFPGPDIIPSLYTATGSDSSEESLLTPTHHT